MNRLISRSRSLAPHSPGTSPLFDKFVLARFLSWPSLVAIALLLVTLTLAFHSAPGVSLPLKVLGKITRRFGAPFASAPTSLPPGKVLWSADMETGDLSQWCLPDSACGPNAGGGVFDSGTAVANVDALSVAHSGIHSAKLYINTFNSPGISTSGVRLFRWLEPNTSPDLYYSVWYYFPRRYNANGNPGWWNVFQWKSKHGDTSDPFFALNVGNRSDGSMYFYLFNQNARTSYSQSLKNIPDSQWIHVEAFHVCAGDKTGHVTFWQDGAKIFDVSNVQTRYPNGNCSWSVNNYSASLDPPTATIYVDDAAVCSGGRCP